MREFQLAVKVTSREVILGTFASIGDEIVPSDIIFTRVTQKLEDQVDYLEDIGSGNVSCRRPRAEEGSNRDNSGGSKHISKIGAEVNNSR